VTFTDYMLLLEYVAIGRAFRSDDKGMKCIQNFSVQNYFKTPTWKTEKGMGK
jgi:hypothetical protein